jgi:hypothetical protein
MAVNKSFITLTPDKFYDTGPRTSTIVEKSFIALSLSVSPSSVSNEHEVCMHVRFQCPILRSDLSFLILRF